MEVAIAIVITIQDLGCKIQGGCELSAEVGHVSFALYAVDVGINLFAKFLIWCQQYNRRANLSSLILQ